MKSLLAIFLGLSLAACATKYPQQAYQPYNEASSTELVYWPPLNQETTVQLGEPMVKASKITQLPVISVEEKIEKITNYRENRRMRLTIPAGRLIQVGTDGQGGQYFSKPGKSFAIAFETRGQFGETEQHFGGIHLSPRGEQSIYWILSGSETQTANLLRIEGAAIQKSVVSKPPEEAAFRQELVYSGISASTLSIVYREFKDDMARPAFFQDLKYDFSKGSEIGFHKARFIILSAGNTSITYKPVSHFSGE